MKLDNYECDWCKNTYNKVQILELKVPSGREMDASGNGYNNLHKNIDVCIECAKKALVGYIRLEFDKK